jgi:hypothetical protein
MFKPGQSGNPSGRRKGSKNKKSEKVRMFIERLLTDQQITKDVKNELLKLKGRDKIKLYTELAQYCLPKITAASLDIDGKLERLTDDQLVELYEQVLKSAK